MSIFSKMKENITKARVAYAREKEDLSIKASERRAVAARRDAEKFEKLKSQAEASRMKIERMKQMNEYREDNARARKMVWDERLKVPRKLMETARKVGNSSVGASKVVMSVSGAPRPIQRGNRAPKEIIYTPDGRKIVVYSKPSMNRNYADAYNRPTYVPQRPRRVEVRQPAYQPQPSYPVFQPQNQGIQLLPPMFPTNQKKKKEEFRLI